jgi:hypothetical protein
MRNNQPVQAIGSNSFWTILISTEKLKSYNDVQLTLKPVVKAKVAYRSLKDDRSTAYEDLWYGTEEQGLCLGAKRYHALAIPSRDYVTIRLQGGEDLSATQVNAATDAIVRIILDAQLNDDWIESVIVPDALFKTIKEQLHFYKIRAFGDTEDGTQMGPSFDFVLRSDSGRALVSMVYRT